VIRGFVYSLGEILYGKETVNRVREREEGDNMRLFTGEELSMMGMKELQETIKEDKVFTSYIIKIREEGAELPVAKKRELCCALHEVYKKFFEKEEKKEEPRKQETYFYENQTDNLGYQTGDFQRETWFRDRDDE
jgi:hypothetical protein